MRTDNKRKDGRKQRRVLTQATSTIALLLLVCISIVACGGTEKQKETSSDSSVYSVGKEVELPEVEF